MKNKRNFGFGRRMDFAGKEVLRERYGDGHFGTTAAHYDRWHAFSVWARSEGVADMRRVDADAVSRYAEKLKAEGLGIATIQNRVSTVNVVMTHATGGSWQTLSPRELAGKGRNTVRTEPPATIDWVLHHGTVAEMRSEGMERGAAVADLARALGVRSEEAVKATLERWRVEANERGAVNVIEGTKGGRDCERWVPVSQRGMEAIAQALKARPDGSRNLLSPDESYAQARNGWIRQGRDTYDRETGGDGYHDARSAYACERYKALTGSDAPVIMGRRTVEKSIDKGARQVIAYELGHGRIDVVSSYIGGRR